MILHPSSVILPSQSDVPDVDHRSLVNVLDRSETDIEVIADVLERTSQLGSVKQGVDKHFYSNGAFNLVQLMLYVLRQTGPAHVFLSTYSIAEDSISTLRRYVDDGTILSIRFLIDNRVRSISPKPFAHLHHVVPRLIPLHITSCQGGPHKQRGLACQHSGQSERHAQPEA